MSKAKQFVYPKTRHSTSNEIVAQHSIRTFEAQSTLLINMIPGWAASAPLKIFATFSYCGCSSYEFLSITNIGKQNKKKSYIQH